MQLLTSQQAKSLPIEDIRDTLSPVTFMTTPMSHQARCLLWALERSRIAYWLDVGTGKTLLALYTAYLWDCNDVLVICPNSVIQTWIDQIKEHTDFTHTVLRGTADERRRKLAARGNISIINYEGLRVLWGKKVGKKYRPDMAAIDRSRFGAVIVDECFPFDTKVVTNKGTLCIGDIVENKQDLCVLSRSECGCLEWKQVVRHIRLQASTRTVKIVHEHGKLTCTEFHKIYVDGKGWAAARNINENDHVFILDSMEQNDYNNKQPCGEVQQPRELENESNSTGSEGCSLQMVQKRGRSSPLKQTQILLTNMLWSLVFTKQRNEGYSGRTETRAQNTRSVGLQTLRPGAQIYTVRSEESKVLRHNMRSKMESGTTRLPKEAKRAVDKRGKEESIKVLQRTMEESRVCRTSIKKDAREQPNTQTRSKGNSRTKGLFKTAWKYLVGARRESKKNRATNTLEGGLGQWVGIRNCDSDEAHTRQDEVSTKMLQTRYWERESSSSNRGRWNFPQAEKTKSNRQKKREGLIASRVVSIEIQERTNNEGLNNGACTDRGVFVYNLEVEDNHNYFADGVLVSNCHRTKSGRALVSRVAMELSRRAKHCIIMTGTPLTKDQKDLWSEMAVMDMGRSLGNNYWNFVRTYFRPAGFDWKLKRDSLEKILEKLKPHTIRYERSECFDLPERTYEKRRTYMTKEQTSLMTSVMAQESGDDDVWTTTAALQCGNKLAQISGGFIYGIDHKAKRLKSNPKLDELASLFDEITGKVIIYHHYAEEGRMIEELLRKLKIKFCSARGEITDKDAQIMKFQKDKNVQVLVAHPSCGGEGINLQCASTMIFYSNGYHYALRVQAEGRIYRLGQKNRCLYIDIVADDGTGDGIDFRILRSLKTKDDAATAVLDYIRGKVG